MSKCFTQSIQQAVAFGPGQQVENHFAIARRLENCALLLEPFAERYGVDQITVVNKRNCSVRALHDNRLSVTFVAVSRRRITRVADCVYSFEFRNDIFGKNIRHISHGLVRVHLTAIRR